MVYNSGMPEETLPPRFPPFRIFFLASLLLALFGWGGLVVLFITTLPTLGPRWLFFFLLTSGVSGLAMPVAYFLNRRFMSKPPADGTVILRQAMWAGIYASLLSWLQQGRVLTIPLAIALLLGFATLEFLLRLRETSLWKPQEPGNG